jgi:hypothetical protein
VRIAMSTRLNTRGIRMQVGHYQEASVPLRDRFGNTSITSP